MNIRQKIYAGALSDKKCSVNTGRPICMNVAGIPNNCF